MSKKNIKELVEEAGVKLISIGENIYRGQCPFHINVNTPSFTVYLSTSSWFCFGESIGGDIYSFYSRLHNCSYRASKEALDGQNDTLEECVQMLDGIGVVDEVNYNNQTNFALSKFCRDLLYKRPELENKIMEFFKHLDNELKNPINQTKMQELIKASRELEKGN